MSAQRLLPLGVILAALLMTPLSYSQSDVPPRTKPATYDDQVQATVCSRCGSHHSQCELWCCPRKVIETEEKPFWKVTCENICVPGFRFPWEKNRLPICGWVRTVNVLEEDAYECETCGYEWSVKCVRTQSESRQHCKCPRCQSENR